MHHDRRERVLVSVIPGAPGVTSAPYDLRDRGYNVTETGEGERILPGARSSRRSSPVRTALWSR